MSDRQRLYDVLEVVKVVDGDTVDMLLAPQDDRRPVFASPWADQGFHVETRVAWFVVGGQMSIETQTRALQRIRLLGVDTPERGKPGFVAATEFTRKWLAEAGALTVTTSKSDTFGRYLGNVLDERQYSLTKDLIALGHGKVWGRGGIVVSSPTQEVTP